MEILVVAPEKGPLLYRFIFTKGGMSRLRSFVSRTAGIVRKEAARQLIERVAKLNFQCAELTHTQADNLRPAYPHPDAAASSQDSV
jgi:hypothetical protein